MSELKPEHRLIPFEASSLPPGPWLVFAPHADDETFGMGGSLLKAHDEGRQTHLVVMTDGALGGSTEGLVDIRKQEVQEAAQILGIDSVDSWQEPDRGLKHSAQLVNKIMQKIQQVGAASVFFPGPLELHPDHRHTALLVWAAMQNLSKEAVAPDAYSYEIGVQNPVNLFIDITAQRTRKARAMAIYASQNDENNYEELVLALDKGRTFTLAAAVSHAEGFYRYSPEQLQLSLQEVTHNIIDLYF